MWRGICRPELGDCQEFRFKMEREILVFFTEFLAYVFTLTNKDVTISIKQEIYEYYRIGDTNELEAKIWHIKKTE